MLQAACAVDVLTKVANLHDNEMRALALACKWANDTSATAQEVLQEAQKLYPEALGKIKLGRCTKLQVCSACGRRMKMRMRTLSHTRGATIIESVAALR